jgi:hypothetical protein
MTTTLLRRLFLALCFLPLSAAAALADDPRVTGLMDLFSHACLSTHADPDLVRAWATGQKLSEVTNPQGQAIFMGSGGGDAWFFQVAGTGAVLSTRRSGAWRTPQVV